MEEPVGRRFGAELGRGALGRVVAIVDGSESGSERESGLAGKILHPSHRLDVRARARFASEAAMLRGLRHPNLVAVHGIERIDGEEVLLMERVAGPDLATLIAREGPMPLARLAAIGRGIADGLAAAHRAGLVHRDLKPHNVLVAPGDVAKVADFGLARTTSFVGAASGAGQPAVVGTPDYLAPEAVDPLALDPRADLYALGCILHEMATGAPPYAAPTAFALLEAHREAPLPVLEGQPPALRRLIRWLLAKSPADRPQSAAVVADALAELGRTTTALAPIGAADLDPPVAVAAGRCARCAAALVAAVPVCFSCGAEQPSIEPGRHSVFVTGPGPISHKLDPALRNRLTDWLRANPSLGLEVGDLARRLPRLPFPLVVGVSERTAARLLEALRGLGLEVTARRGGRFRLRSMRRKARQLARRAAGIGFGTFWIMQFFWKYILFFVSPLALLGAAAGGGALIGAAAAGRVATRRTRVGQRAPAGLGPALDRVAGVLSAIGEVRHRESLRAVVQRAAALAAMPSVAASPALVAELARMVDHASVAAARVDELERALVADDLEAADPAVRARLRERDRCAASLLGAAGFLDAFHASQVAGQVDGASTDERLAELGHHVAALEELASP